MVDFIRRFKEITGMSRDVMDTKLSDRCIVCKNLTDAARNKCKRMKILEKIGDGKFSGNAPQPITKVVVEPVYMKSGDCRRTDCISMTVLWQCNYFELDKAAAEWYKKWLVENTDLQIEGIKGD